MFKDFGTSDKWSPFERGKNKKQSMAEFPSTIIVVRGGSLVVLTDQSDLLPYPCFHRERPGNPIHVAREIMDSIHIENVLLQEVPTRNLVIQP